MSKTITVKVLVPGWARWVAQERDGTIYCYRVKPMADTSKIWISTDLCADTRVGFQKLCQTVPPKDWRRTLKRVAGGRK